jgi:hypothetical protein
MLDIAPKIILCIPGMWKTRAALAEALADSGSALRFVGEHLHDRDSGDQFDLSLVNYDPDLAKAFAIAGRRSLTEPDIDTIKRHVQIAFLSGDGGSVERARAILHAGAALVDAGGLGVKVETSGVAHSPANWKALDAAPESVALYHAFVTMIAAENVYYSVGMHNLGLPDATVPRSLAPRDAAKTLEGFLLYLLYENPELSDTHTFSLGPGSPRFKMQDAPCTRFPKEHPFFNPYDIWMLH